MEHNGISYVNERMSHQLYGITKWCWRD